MGKKKGKGGRRFMEKWRGGGESLIKARDASFIARSVGCHSAYLFLLRSAGA